MNTKQTEALKLALKRAFNLGQTYWQQADSEYPSQWKKADVTLASFNQLVEDTIREALAEQPEQEPKVLMQEIARLHARIKDLERDVEFLSRPAQQEPVAWRVRCTDPMRDWVLMYRHPKTEEQFSNIEIQFLYTSPPIEATPLASQRSVKPWVHATTWRGLTDEEIRNWWRIENGLEDCNMAKLVDFTLVVRAIEAKLKEKNA